MDGPVKKDQRPVNLDLRTVQFPPTAIASILHRVSGVLVFFFLAILLWLLAMSLSSPVGFERAAGIVDNFLVKLILWGLLTALMYHIVGGIRHLIMDLGYWEELESGNASAKVSFIITGLLAIVVGVIVW
ncbi:succinate dehydrogenase cytochrome b556 subunit [Aliagarivorans taiwanensis]|uniref:succinate dehydrogenase cytochrome b556 subunit n=1 Tax=Aliagarivorans taiwanensis TaxID=561966 RepID=UPI000557FD48|nr:succinate dehydrogenase cytochrome b556 subunit [Aliagarivorans taiwanensis]